jgi:gamma-glutamylcyclotransferase (GGCT)/AIG2-like uncharacterized protein YtfP
MSLLFVYGTLKTGGSNHACLAGQALVGRAQTLPGFVLYGLDGYPGMVADGSTSEGVVGEVWSVDEACLGRLDELEGTAEGFYRRAEVALAPPFNAEVVETYLHLGNVEGRPRIGSNWPV